MNRVKDSVAPGQSRRGLPGAGGSGYLHVFTADGGARPRRLCPNEQVSFMALNRLLGSRPRNAPAVAALAIARLLVACGGSNASAPGPDPGGFGGALVGAGGSDVSGGRAGVSDGGARAGVGGAGISCNAATAGVLGTSCNASTAGVMGV